MSEPTTDNVDQLKARIQDLQNDNIKLQAELSINETKDQLTTRIKTDIGSESFDNDEKQDTNDSSNQLPFATSDEKIKHLETQLNNYKRANKELAMKAVHYNAMNSMSRNLPTIWHQPHININHISTFINKIPIAHKNKLWERHCDSEDSKQMCLNNLDSLMFSIVALCIKIHDRSIKTPSQDKLMPRLKIYCKNIKWNIKQKNKKEKEANKLKNISSSNNNNNSNSNDDSSITTNGSGGSSDPNENKEDSKDKTETEEDSDNKKRKKSKSKYLVYDDFVNHFHRWMVEGPPPPTPEQQQKMLYYQRYENDCDSDDSDQDGETGFLKLIDKVEDCLKLIDKSRF